jgi:hypothetical protein
VVDQVEGLTYNLDPNEAWERAHVYSKARGLFENFERMWNYDSPLDFMEEGLDYHYFKHHSQLERLAHLPRKESHVKA